MNLRIKNGSMRRFKSSKMKPVRTKRTFSKSNKISSARCTKASDLSTTS